MRVHRLLLSFLGAVLVSTQVLAQPTPPAVPPPQSRAGWITQLQPDQWQTSNLEGLDVYSSNNGDKIGDISDLIFDTKRQGPGSADRGWRVSWHWRAQHCGAVRPNQVR
jgi:hypothetical protein